MVDFARTFAVKVNKFTMITDGPEFRDQAPEVRMLIDLARRVTPHWKPQIIQAAECSRLYEGRKG